jgi:diguanylate cyclase (GGDEF)-like protein
VFLALTILVLVLVFAVLGMRHADRVFHDLDLRDARASVGLVMRWLDDQAVSARLAAEDMAASPGTVAFVSTGDKGVAERDLTDASLTSAGTDFVIFLNDNGEVTYARFLRHGDLSDQIVAAVRENPKATQFTAQRRSGSALVASTAGPVALGLAPVAARRGQKGDSGTTLITGRVLGNTPSTAFAEQTGLPASTVTWFSPRQPDLPASAAGAADELRASRQFVAIKKTDEGQIYSYGVVDDPMSRPVAIIRVKTDPAIQSSRGDLLRVDLIYLLIFLVASIGALIIVLDTSVLHRLSSVLGGVHQVRTADTTGGVRIPVEGHDEIADLATSVNDILETIDRQHDRVLTLTTTDDLTRVCNRSRFLEEVRRQLEKSKRLGEQGALLWFDLDHFKQVNDTHGLATGDHVLVEFAELLSTTTRAYCTIGRVGGDDFAVLDPGADRVQAGQAAKRLLDTLSEHSYEDDGRQISVGVSVGVACYPDHGKSAEVLLEAAENAKDESKRDGGGRVTLLPAPPSPPSDESGGTAPPGG